MLPSVLHVWSGADFWGRKMTVSSYSGGSAGYALADNGHPGCRWESNWMDFGDNSIKHRVFSVEAEIVSYGNLGLTLSWAQD